MCKGNVLCFVSVLVLLCLGTTLPAFGHTYHEGFGMERGMRAASEEEEGGWGYNPSDLSSHHPKAWIVPKIHVPSVEATASFYERAFGLEKREKLTAADGSLISATMSWKGDLHRFLYIEKETESFTTPKTSGSPFGDFVVYIKDMKEVYERAIAAGCTSKKEPGPGFPGEESSSVEDLNGFTWVFVTPLQFQTDEIWSLI